MGTPFEPEPVAPGQHTWDDPSDIGNALRGRPGWTYQVLPPDTVDARSVEYSGPMGQERYYSDREREALGLQAQRLGAIRAEGTKAHDDRRSMVRRRLLIMLAAS